ncbi:hypothetical protein MVEN_00553700 [Mycena venus]|uniref:F-box domain-containing protein n=1 Tax=Mycena venus TaxID=2733690 RepID=A0A8H7D7X3_9AGAR|nr:hypothetical protein MVEN_00553700 [Mycena venus]
MGRQGFRAGVARFFRALRRGRDDSTLHGSEESTLVNCDAVCHITRLPDPVLGAIFALSKDAEKELAPGERVKVSRPVEQVVSQVAVRWRVVALGLPDLWSSVDARVRPEHQRALLEWYLDHSEGRPLDVSISLSQEDWHTEGELVLAEVLAEAPRLRCLSIRADFPGADAAVRDACMYLRAPMLEHFSFISLDVPQALTLLDPGDHIYEENFAPVVFTRGVARLKVLRLQHMPKALYPPLRGVTTLHLEEYQCPPMACTRLLALLRALPALANLSLYGDVIASWPAEGALHLPCLRSLRSASSDQAGHMLLALNAPILDSLTLKDVKRVSELTSSLEHASSGLRLPALRTLVLDGSLSVRALGALFCELSSVAKLRLLNCDADEALDLLSAPDRQLLPGLKKVMVHQVRSHTALDGMWAREVAVRVHVDVQWTGAGSVGRWTSLPPWPPELGRVDADDLFMQLRRGAPPSIWV